MEEEHCRTAFFRGAFLAGGSVTDPAKRYHLELATSHYNVSREMSALLLDAGFFPKETTRKSNYITYFKQSEAIEDFLTAIGAPLSAMAVDECQSGKGGSGRCQPPGELRCGQSGQGGGGRSGRIEAIRRLTERGMLEDLPPKLQATAELRVEHPELTPVSQLAELLQPPVTKSCLNHRLRKLMELGRRGGEGEME